MRKRDPLFFCNSVSIDFDLSRTLSQHDTALTQQPTPKVTGRLAAVPKEPSTRLPKTDSTPGATVKPVPTADH